MKFANKAKQERDIIPNMLYSIILSWILILNKNLLKNIPELKKNIEVRKQNIKTAIKLIFNYFLNINNYSRINSDRLSRNNDIIKLIKYIIITKLI